MLILSSALTSFSFVVLFLVLCILKHSSVSELKDVLKACGGGGDPQDNQDLGEVCLNSYRILVAKGIEVNDLYTNDNGV